MADEELSLVFKNDDNNDILILISELSDRLPENPSPELIKAILRTALNPLKNDEPGIIGLDNDTGSLLAYWNIASTRINVESLKQCLAQFIEFQKTLITRLQEHA